MKKILITVLVVLMAYPSQNWGMLVPAQVSQGSDRAADLKTVQLALESKVVRQRLSEFKLSSDEVDSRLNKLSDSQIHQMASQIKSMNPAGREEGFFVSLLVVVLVVFFIVFLMRRI